MKLVLPRKNLDEIRSYRFFTDVTAPAIATTFDAEFWRTQVPRICQSDPAIWHAIVSFGSVHENYVSETPTAFTKNLFAIQQFNASIRCLTDLKSSNYNDKWRALVVSTIFTCVCSLEALEGQARMHLEAGCKLLQEIEHENQARGRSKAARTKPQDSSTVAPVSFSSISAIIRGLQIREQALNRGGISNVPTLITQHESFSMWRYYSAPCTPPFLTANSLSQANRAAESLMNGLVYFMQKHADEIKDLLVGKGDAKLLESVVSKQKPEMRCFQEIGKAIGSFEAETEAGGGFAILKEVGERQLEKSLLTLKLYHETIRYILLQDPDEPDMMKRYAKLPAMGMRIVELADQVLGLTEAETRSGKPSEPGPPTSSPLFIVAHSGFTQEARRRAIRLLKRPHMPGMWDTLLSASLAEAIMAREEEAAYEDHLRSVAEGTPTRPQGTSEDVPVNPLHRIFSITLSLTGRKEATVVLRTWQEWINGIPGRQSVVRW
ncbi:hypothetical protein ACJ41O_006021 [Fusarium nematophilum]